MKSKTIILYLLLAFSIISGHYFSVQSHILKGDLKIALIIDLYLVLLCVVSAFILYTKTVDAEKFTLRFLIVTTIQFIGFLSLIAALVFKKIPDLKYWCISAVAVFCLILIVQTTLLLLAVRTSSTK